ncbi:MULTISPECIES: hypothetical protein [Rhizobium]|uniref:hypothetical protein n=1 Tax=Rhizobium TaxID=379 RepID=UPI00117B7FB7|nr:MULTISPECIES: hypothetical protein [Rhizobium]MBB3298495.1 hypothetical protein [Rhizobium sp. BK112]MBB3367597.1 hypothetical protein [Rhizobium sp. BK077]MBB4178387.1 hypothetical protein [Rhizobium sp. BK109]UTS87526.1 hypothetical protein NE851_04260 [Rhizobium anhuiense bv. trifolii]
MGISSTAAACAISAGRLIAAVRDRFQFAEKNFEKRGRSAPRGAIESGICLSDKQLNRLGISRHFR